MTSIRRAARAGSWLTDTEEQPRADGLSGNGFRRRARFYRVYLVVAALLAPVLLLALVITLTTVAAPTQAAPAVRDSPGRAAATQALLDWLGGPNPGLVAGRLLLWSGAAFADTTGAGTADFTGDVPLFVEVDTFVVADGAGNRFTAEVQVLVDDQGRAAVLSGPSLTPLPVLDADAARNAGPWPGRDTQPADEQVAAAVRAWAAAYTSGGPAALRLTVGDPDRGHAYLPLTGVADVTTTVGPCIGLDAGTVAARVQLAVTWVRSGPSGSTTQPDPADSPVPPRIAFDVLVTGADTAAPRVVAWGGPGAGPTLTAFGNAVAATPRRASPRRRRQQCRRR